jgi:hypothetical protein
MGFPETFRIVVSDTQAYKQFGNSVVVPLVAKIAKQIASYLESFDEAQESPAIKVRTKGRHANGFREKRSSKTVRRVASAKQTQFPMETK